MTDPSNEEVEVFMKENRWSNVSGVDPSEWFRRAKSALIQFKRREDARKKLTDLLNEKDIHMIVGGCGCCDSPRLKVVFNGDIICDEGNFNFSNIEGEDA